MSSEQRQSPLSQQLQALAAKAFPAEAVTPPAYARMQYPKLIPLMRFTVQQTRLRGFGHLMTMDTCAMGGMMQLSTIVFTPGEGGDVPFLLIDTMQMKKKSLAYAEFYDCTAAKRAWPQLSALKAKYAALPDYAEKDAWYVARRTPYSLIKGGEGADPQALQQLVLDSAQRYLEAAAQGQDSTQKQANIAGLAAFRQELCTRGNPSTPTLTKLFGEAGAEKFYQTVIMPL